MPPPRCGRAAPRLLLLLESLLVLVLQCTNCLLHLLGGQVLLLLLQLLQLLEIGGQHSRLLLLVVVHGLLLRLPDLLKFGPCRRCYLLRLALLLLPHACRRCCLLLLLQHGLGLPSLLHQLRM